MSTGGASGRLRERITLWSRIQSNPDAPNDLGNVEAEWVDRGSVKAEPIHVRGGEAVMAGRLQGRHTQIMRVWASALTRSIETDWRVTDARTGAEFAVRDVTVTPDRRWVELLCESGVPA